MQVSQTVDLPTAHLSVLRIFQALYGVLHDQTFQSPSNMDP